jgi:hypothetical protein
MVRVSDEIAARLFENTAAPGKCSFSGAGSVDPAYAASTSHRATFANPAYAARTSHRVVLSKHRLQDSVS